MTELNKTEQDKTEKHVLSFGEHLYVERKKQNLSVAEVAKAIHLSEKVIDAIERSEVDRLPQPAFVQGYLRAYAKFLGMSETLVLQEYAHAVPHKQEAELQPRSTLPRETSSNSPFVKMVTILLFMMMLVAAIYASYSYYKNALLADQVEMETQTSLALPEAVAVDEAGAGDELTPAADEAVISEQNMLLPEVITNAELKPSEPPVSIVPETVVSKPAEVVKPKKQQPVSQLVAKGADTIVLSADQVSWVEVKDANAENLYYDLLEEGKNITLKGTAPFKIFLGNAPHVSITMNDISVNVDKYIRSNNIANFSISVDQQQVVFH